MSLEVTINVPGLKELSEALMQMAPALGGNTMIQRDATTVRQDQQENQGHQSTEEVPWGNASASQTNTAPAPPAVVTPVQAPVQAVQQSATVPTSEPMYTREDLSKAAMQLMDKGMQAQLIQLIQSFGVASLVELPPEHYGNFATGLRGMGAQI